MFVDLRRTAASLACAGLVGACSSNVVMRRPPAVDTGYLGVYQRCTEDAECTNAEEYDSSKLNDSHTTYFQLPQCPYGIHELALLRGGSEVLVRCAAPDPTRGNAGADALPIATAGGGTR